MDSDPYPLQFDSSFWANTFRLEAVLDRLDHLREELEAQTRSFLEVLPVQSSASPQVVDVEVGTPPKRIRSDPDLSQKEEPYKCPVCLLIVSKLKPVATKCGHVFCRKCIRTAISAMHKCPLCNKKLSAHQYSRIYL
ncbi:E3 ubiquitin-protein ligase complex slx8-rfp subunit slx8-like [Drosophila elegans]|uniref:E3 ubiquitin-protein ligase complex slx8-rfp subunit slx8-like n=1 Tax=Drosophila elegans TaxID=30023 RepID=UPI0007E77A7E|nr:E3 ubiquitin-protein ligase complex slx8-rfp subunit slx8-like [Drosophila elegans]